MEFQFVSMQEFLAMEGHGPYVWAAYGITLAGLLGLGVKIVLARRNFYKVQASIAKRKTQSAS